jgi:EmrB/QacA subfamily drug resistance transporter
LRAPGRSEAASFDELPRARVFATMAGALLTLLLAALDQTIVGTAMPRIIAELQGFERYAWVATAYMVASTAVVPIVGKLSDLYGRRPFFLGGVVAFLAASALCGASADMTQLIVFRGLQGIGAGMIMAMTLTVIGDLFPPAQRGRIQGLFAAVWGVSSVIGPPIGGYLTDSLSWRWVFYVNLPVGLIALAVLFLTFPTIAANRTNRSIDCAGAATLLLWVIPLLLALSWGGTTYAWGSPQVLGMLGLAVVGVAAFLLAELRAAEPILPLTLFRHRAVVIPILMAMTMSAGMFGAILFMPLFVQAVIGASATESGAVLVPMTVGLVVASVASGQVVSRIGRYRLISIMGFAITTIGMLLLTRLSAGSGYVEVMLAVLVIGAGLGTVMPIVSVAVQNAVPRAMLGVATAASTFFRSISGTLSAAIFGSLLVNRFNPAFHEALPSNVAAAIPPEELAVVGNPQALLNPETGAALHDIAARSGAGAQVVSEALLAAIRQALAVSLHDVFMVAALVVGVGLVIALFLPELPLRGAGGSAGPREAARNGASMEATGV